MGNISRRTFIKGGVITAFGILAVDAFWFEKYMVDWNQFDISHKAQDPIRLIQLSDLHLQDIHYGHHSIAEKINITQADLLAITGDAIDNKNNAELLDRFLGLIDPEIEKVAILGNWEHWGKIDLSQLKEIYLKHNCTLLVNESKFIRVKGRKVNVIGVDDFVGGNADFNQAVSNMKPADSNIVLSHCPVYKDFIDQMNKTISIDYILSGHTHGGQVNLLGYVPFKPVGSGRYLKGWYRKTGAPLFVSKGIGTSRVPVRLGSRAEVVEMIF